MSYRLQLTSAYNFANVLARAQWLQWLEMPVHAFQPQEDGVERFSAEHDFRR